MKRALWAMCLSCAFHLLGATLESLIGFEKDGVRKFDSIVSSPARIFSEAMPPGHGVPQLVFPFFFSLAFYTAMFWLLLYIYARLWKTSPDKTK